MKNINLPLVKEICTYCRNIGYFTEYNFYQNIEADGLLCPICKNNEFYLGEDIEIRLLDKFEDINFCINCNIIYNSGCVHSSSYFDVLMNSHFINMWKLNNENKIYYGMPLFKNKEEYIENIDNLEILEWICPNSYYNSDSCNEHHIIRKKRNSNSCNNKGINYIENIRKIQLWWKEILYNPHTERGKKFIWKQAGYK